MRAALSDKTPVEVFGQHKFDKGGDYVIIPLKPLAESLGRENLDNILIMRSKQSSKKILIGTELPKKEEPDGKSKSK